MVARSDPLHHAAGAMQGSPDWAAAVAEAASAGCGCHQMEVMLEAGLDPPPAQEMMVSRINQRWIARFC